MVGQSCTKSLSVDIATRLIGTGEDDVVRGDAVIYLLHNICVGCVPGIAVSLDMADDS